MRRIDQYTKEEYTDNALMPDLVGSCPVLWAGPVPA